MCSRLKNQCEQLQFEFIRQGFCFFWVFFFYLFKSDPLLQISAVRLELDGNCVCEIFEPQRRLRQVEAAERWNKIIQTFSFSISSTDNKKKTCGVYEFIHTLQHFLSVSLKSFSLSSTYWLKIDAEHLCRPLHLRSYPASKNSTAANFDPLASYWCQPRPGPTLNQQLWGSFTGHLCKFPRPPRLVLGAINNALSQTVYFMKKKKKNERGYCIINVTH